MTNLTIVNIIQYKLTVNHNKKGSIQRNRLLQPETPLTSQIQLAERERESDLH